MSIQFAGKTYEITSARWDSSRQVGVIVYKDEAGEEHETLALGLAPHEQRQAVADDLMQSTHDAASLQLSHGDLCRLSQVFNRGAVLSFSQDTRINDWLKAQIAMAGPRARRTA